MKNKRSFLVISSLIIISMIVVLISLSILASSKQADVCCEKTKSGVWCMNDKPESCDSNYRKVPTNCEATSFCKEGCCYDSQEGICMENTPERVCKANNGTWSESKDCDIPQCNLGCCVLGDQAAFVTLTRCKKLSSFYGLETDFRTNIGDEISCIAIAQAQDKGACVYELDYGKTCKFTTRENCKIDLIGDVNGTITNTSVKFYKDYLCSAEELGTNCGPTDKTTCIEGKDEVYFVDSCGNPANIYDASKINDKEYWKKIVPKEDSCGAGRDNKNSQTCGNCDYFLGSYCRDYDSRKGDKRPLYGDYICRDLDCKDTSVGEKKHGESWCYYDAEHGKGKDPVGSRHYRHICYMGEELIEPCADFRQQQCVETSVDTSEGAYSMAGCVVNRWQDCTSQTNKEDCENSDKRDCIWVEGLVIRPGGMVLGNLSEVMSNKGGEEISENTSCFPDVPPGLKFWESGEAESLCSLGTVQCVVEYEKNIFGKKKCVKNCECLEDSWKEKMNNICVLLGDCGVYKNYLGREGYKDRNLVKKAGEEEIESGLFGFSSSLIKSRIFG